VLRTTLAADNLFLQSLVDEIREQEVEDVTVVEAEILKLEEEAKVQAEITKNSIFW
jgi:hypothetical protein